MDAELKRIGDELEVIGALIRRLDDRVAPAPHAGPPVVYLSGRWKLRDGTMYGR